MKGQRRTPRITKRTYLSSQHLFAAWMFCNEAEHIEARTLEMEVRDRPVFDPSHRSYVIGALLASVSFLESRINEFFSDLAYRRQELEERLGAETVELLAKMWRRGIPRTARYSIIEKYEIALELAGKEPFDRGIVPYQNVDCLIKLRNSLVHYEPETILSSYVVDRGPDEIHRLEKLLRGRFAPNPLADDSLFNTPYPDEILSHGCACWAIESSSEFVNSFRKKMNVFDLSEAIAYVEVDLRERHA